MKELYESLETELIRFEAADVITASDGSGDTSGHVKATETPVVPANL